MLYLKIIEIGQTEYTKSMVLTEIPRKKFRPCIDKRVLNSIIRTECPPYLNFAKRREKVAAKNIFVISLEEGYWQIILSKRAQRYVTFVTSFEIHLPLRIPIGYVNTPYYISKLMGRVIGGGKVLALEYLDNVGLAQRDSEGNEYPIIYLNKKFSSAARKCSTIDRIIYIIHKFRPYLDGQQFVIETNHNPLVWLKTNSGKNARLQRWSLALQPYSYTVAHKKGRLHVNADSLSRTNLN